MQSEIVSWRRRGSNGRFVVSKPLDVQLTSLGVVLDRFTRTSPRSLNFRFANRTKYEGRNRFACAHQSPRLALSESAFRQ